MVHVNVKKQKLVDLSFMPSLKCNLSCPCCMYEASSENKAVLDLKKTRKFIATINFNKINAVGFYGGEISSDYATYQKVIDLVPKNIVKFTITNGTWSKNSEACKKFIDFVKKSRLQVFISRTKFHRPFQNVELLKELAQKHSFILKEEDQIIPMGRAQKTNWTCSKRCLTYTCPMRLTLNPYGDIMFCNCDGVYPIVGTYGDDFDTVVENGLRIEGFCVQLK